MATLVLSAAGAALGGAAGGSVAGLSAAALGRAAGAVAGGLLDQRLLGDGAAVVETGRVDRFRLMGAREGAPVPRVFGRMRVPGQVIWASRFLERVDETTRGGKGAPRATTRSHRYSVSLAVALCAGPIDSIGRIWADGRELPSDAAEMRLHTGAPDQTPDPLIEAVEGAGAAPAYRDTAYLVIEDLDLAPFGNRLPQLHVEVYRQPRPDPSVSEEIAPPLGDLLRGVALSPGTGEFSLATVPVRRRLGPGRFVTENVNSPSGRPDLLTALDQLEAAAPGLKSVSLIVSWFGDDLRCGRCAVYPAVETPDKTTEPLAWSVAGIDRESARMVGRDAEGRPVFGGTPSDETVIQAIREIRARGWKVLFYPFLLMDAPPGSGLPDPYGGGEQAAYPWRGRITLDVAPGRPGSADMTAEAAGQVEAFFGAAAPRHFALDGERVVYDGPEEWSFRRFILHYAHLCEAAGGVDSFAIGSEMRGLTTIRDTRTSFPAVSALKALAADAKAVLVPETDISYAADWSEYASYAPQDGSDDLLFHLDPLWADPAIDFIGIDNYLPLSDWRDGASHADVAAGSVYALSYLKGGVEGGEYYDWYYKSNTDRLAQMRTPIRDGLYRDPSVFRVKDLRNWWANPHYDRLGGIRDSLLPDGAEPASWIGFSDGVLTPEPGVFLGRFAQAARVASGGHPNDRSRSRVGVPVAAGRPYRWRAYVMAGSSGGFWAYLQDNVPPSPSIGYDFASGNFGFDNVDGAIREASATDLGDGVTLLEWVVEWETGGLAFAEFGPWSGVAGEDVVIVAAELHEIGVSTTGWVPKSKPIRFTEIGCPAVDKGANQPNVFFDPKSSESALPHFSTGSEDPEMQSRYLQASLTYWSDPGKNPVSPVYGGRMIDMDAAHVWTWDARPWPDFPQRRDVWTDGANHRLGHWITGRLGSAGLAEIVAEICADSGVEAVDVDRLHGVVPGYWLETVSTGRQALQPLMLGWGFDAVETGDRLGFAPARGDAAEQLDPARLVVGDDAEPGGGLRCAREAAAQTPSAIRLAYLDADGSYQPAAAEARDAATPAHGVETVNVPAALGGAEAEAIVRRWRAEAEFAAETVEGNLPPSRLALEPGDVIAAPSGLGPRHYRIDRIEDGRSRRFSARRVDPVQPPARSAPERRCAPPAAPLRAPPAVVFLDLPEAAGGPRVAAFAEPWPGPLAIWRSSEGDGWSEVGAIDRPAVLGELLAPPPAAAPHRWANGPGLEVRLWGGGLGGEARRRVLDGANLAALETADGRWELLQFAGAEMTGPETWRLTGLLRGQAGTEFLIDAPRATGARFALLDGAPAALPISAAEIGLERRWRIGPARFGFADPACVETDFASAGAAWRPFAPARLTAVWDHGDACLSWAPRAPDDADGWGAAGSPAPPVGAAWRVTILKDGATRRMIDVLEPCWRYDAAAQAADGLTPPFVVAVAESRPLFGPGPETRIEIDG